MDNLLEYLDNCYSFNRDPAIKMTIDEINRLDEALRIALKEKEELAAALVSKQGDSNETN